MNDLGGNPRLWALSGLAYQLFHTLRRQLPTPKKRDQPERLRTRIFRVPAHFTWRSGYWRINLDETELPHGLLPRTLEVLTDSDLQGPPARAA